MQKKIGIPSCKNHRMFVGVHMFKLSFKRRSGGARTMISRSVVIRRNSCNWRPQEKTKIKKKNQIISSAGFVSPVIVAVVFAVFSGFIYIYSINQSAVKGYEIRKIEKEIAQMRNENEGLRMKEAEFRSFYKIEETSKSLNMLEANEVTYINESSPLALNSGQ